MYSSVVKFSSSFISSFITSLILIRIQSCNDECNLWWMYCNWYWWLLIVNHDWLTDWLTPANYDSTWLRQTTKQILWGPWRTSSCSPSRSWRAMTQRMSSDHHHHHHQRLLGKYVYQKYATMAHGEHLCFAAFFTHISLHYSWLAAVRSFWDVRRETIHMSGREFVILCHMVSWGLSWQALAVTCSFLSHSFHSFHSSLTLASFQHLVPRFNSQHGHLVCFRGKASVCWRCCLRQLLQHRKNNNK